MQDANNWINEYMKNTNYNIINMAYNGNCI